MVVDAILGAAHVKRCKQLVNPGKDDLAAGRRLL
jgi:hypothetical protein